KAAVWPKLRRKRNTVTFGMEPATRALLSVEPSSTTMISRTQRRASQTALISSMSAERLFSSLKTAITTLSRGSTDTTTLLVIFAPQNGNRDRKYLARRNQDT